MTSKLYHKKCSAVLNDMLCWDLNVPTSTTRRILLPDYLPKKDQGRLKPGLVLTLHLNDDFNAPLFRFADHTDFPIVWLFHLTVILTAMFWITPSSQLYKFNFQNIPLCCQHLFHCSPPSKVTTNSLSKNKSDNNYKHNVNISPIRFLRHLYYYSI